MAEIRRYVLVDENDQDGDYEFTSFRDARKAAGMDHAVVMRTYEKDVDGDDVALIFDDSELWWTPNGSNTWPPMDKEN